MASLVGVEDRAAGWDDVIAYVDDAGAVTTFAPDPNHRYVGEIAPEPPRRYRRFRGPERALGRTFVPTAFGLEECLADVSEEEYQRYRREAPSVEKDSEESSEVPRRARASSRSPLDGLFDAAGSDGRSDTASEDTDERASEGEGEGESESGEK